MKKAVAPLDPAKMTTLLRAGVLALGPADIGLTAANTPSVWGVMMEFGDAEVVVSLVALLDGSVSIYLSNGAGVIGCGLHPDVRTAAAKMLRLAEPAMAFCAPAAEQPLPVEQRVCFYLLTQRGILGCDASRADLDEGAVALAELYYAGHGIIGMVELLGAGVDLVDEMQLAENAAQRDAPVVDADASPSTQQSKARGRGCRILPYVGNAVRRSQH